MVRRSRAWTKQYSARLKKAREAVAKQIKEIEKIRTDKKKRM